jgi:hypothetical protein
MTRTEDTNFSQVTDIKIYSDSIASGSIVLNYKGYSDYDTGVVFCPVNPRQDDKEKYSETEGMPIYFGSIADLPDL